MKLMKIAGRTSYSSPDPGVWFGDPFAAGSCVRLSGVPLSVVNITYSATSTLTESNGTGGGATYNNMLCRARSGTWVESESDGTACDVPITIGANGYAYLVFYNKSVVMNSSNEPGGDYRGTLTVNTDDGGSGSAGTRLLFIAPLSVTEAIPWSMVLQSKNGVSSETAIPPLAFNSDTWLDYFTQKPMDAQKVGCLKVTGDGRWSIPITITPPSTLVGANGKVINLSASVIKFQFEQTKSNCDSHPEGGSYLNDIGLNGGSEGYVAWGLNTDSTMDIPDLHTNTYTGTIVFSYDYQL